MENRSKSVKTVFVHKDRQKFTFGMTSFNKQLIFNGFLRCPCVARGLSGRPGNVPKSFIFLVCGQLCMKTGPDDPLEGSRECPGVPRSPTGCHFKSILDQFSMSKSMEKDAKC